MTQFLDFKYSLLSFDRTSKIIELKFENGMTFKGRCSAFDIMSTKFPNVIGKFNYRDMILDVVVKDGKFFSGTITSPMYTLEISNYNFENLVYNNTRYIWNSMEKLFFHPSRRIAITNFNPFQLAIYLSGNILLGDFKDDKLLNGFKVQQACVIKVIEGKEETANGLDSYPVKSLSDPLSIFDSHPLSEEKIQSLFAVKNGIKVFNIGTKTISPFESVDQAVKQLMPDLDSDGTNVVVQKINDHILQWDKKIYTNLILGGKNYIFRPASDPDSEFNKDPTKSIEIPPSITIKRRKLDS